MAIPIPYPRGEEGVYYDALGDGRLLYQRCNDCSVAVWYPRTTCPACGGAALEWLESNRRGTVHSFTTLLRAGDPTRADDVPYTVALVDLDEGIRVLGDLAETMTGNPIGRRVEGAIEAHEGRLPVLVFRSPEEPK